MIGLFLVSLGFIATGIVLSRLEVRRENRKRRERLSQRVRRFKGGRNG